MKANKDLLDLIKKIEIDEHKVIKGSFQRRVGKSKQEHLYLELYKKRKERLPEGLQLEKWIIEIADTGNPVDLQRDLLEKLLKVLGELWKKKTQNSTERKIEALLDQVELLYEKNLVTQAGKVFLKAKTQALKYMAKSRSSNREARPNHLLIKIMEWEPILIHGIKKKPSKNLPIDQEMEQKVVDFFWHLGSRISSENSYSAGNNATNTSPLSALFHKLRSLTNEYNRLNQSSFTESNRLVSGFEAQRSIVWKSLEVFALLHRYLYDSQGITRRRLYHGSNQYYGYAIEILEHYEDAHSKFVMGKKDEAERELNYLKEKVTRHPISGQLATGIFIHRHAYETEVFYQFNALNDSWGFDPNRFKTLQDLSAENLMMSLNSEIEDFQLRFELNSVVANFFFGKIRESLPALQGIEALIKKSLKKYRKEIKEIISEFQKNKIDPNTISGVKRKRIIRKTLSGNKNEAESEALERFYRYIYLWRLLAENQCLMACVHYDKREYEEVDQIITKIDHIRLDLAKGIQLHPFQNSVKLLFRTMVAETDWKAKKLLVQDFLNQDHEDLNPPGHAILHWMKTFAMNQK